MKKQIGDTFVADVDLSRLAPQKNVTWKITRENKATYSITAIAGLPDGWALNLYLCKKTGKIKR